MSEPFWVPLGGAGVDYKGDWAAGSQYQPGDVVRRNGVDYLAVNPSLGSTPPVAVLPGAELAYAEFTAPVATPATTEAGATPVVTAPPVTLDGLTPIVVEFFCPGIVWTDAPHSYAYFFDGSTSLGWTWFQGAARVVIGETFPPLLVKRRLVPAAGSHTYSFRGRVSSGAGVQFVAGPGGAGGLWVPGYIRVTR